MECCRICLASDSLINIFESIDIAPNITAIACVDISQEDGLPQYICLLCKHELDISINFKGKCETTFDMLKEQHAKEIEVKESIILNLLSGSKPLDEKLPKSVRESILYTVENSISNNNRVVRDGYFKEEYFSGEADLVSGETGIIYEESTKRHSESDDSIIEIRIQEDCDSLSDHDNMTIVMDADDQMTDVTENEFDVPESLKMRNQDLMCIKCNFYFMNDKCLFDHIKRIHPKTMCQCQICLLHFPTNGILKEHLSARHGVSDDGENIVFRCKICNNTFNLQSELNSHLCSPSNQNLFWCELCRIHFKQEAELENHSKDVHQQRGLEFTCDQCYEKFNRNDLYKKHLQEHLVLASNENQIELLCSECNKCFGSNEEWDKHIDSCSTGYTHENQQEKASKCMDCHQSCAQGSELIAHLPTHRNIKPFVCSICKMSFYKSSSLEKHLLLHVNLIKFTRDQTYLNCETQDEQL